MAPTCAAEEETIALEEAALEDAAPEDLAPDDAAPDDVAPEETVPEDVAPDEMEGAVVLVLLPQPMRRLVIVSEPRASTPRKRT